MGIRVLVLIACCASALPASSDEPLWEWVTPTPQGHDLFAAAAGNGVTIAVGRSGTVIAGSDGNEWRTIRSGSEYSLLDAVWGNGLFVAVGGEVGFEFSPGLGVILTSADGVSWIERHRENHLSLESVAWTGSRFVAVGVGDRVLLSDDGIAWSEEPLGEVEYIYDVAWNGSSLVAVGRDEWWGGQPSHFVSEDGRNWQEFAFDVDAYGEASIAALGERFVVVGGEYDALVSDDGLTWTEAPYGILSDLEFIAAGTDRFVAVGNHSVATSFDGYSWAIEDRPFVSRTNGIDLVGDHFLSCGEDGFMMSSPDGQVWTQLSTRSFDLTGNWEINELATDGSTIVGVGEGAIIITGEHGTQWTRRGSSATSELNAVIWDGSAFWAVGRSRIIRSLDGVHWAEVYFDPDSDLRDIAQNGSLLVAVGRRSGRDVVLTSSDGHSWTARLFDLEGTLLTVGWTGSRWVAAGDGNGYLASSDGVSWQEHVHLLDVTLSDMAWDGHRLVAVGSRLEHGGAVYSTTDGLQWVESSLPEAPQSELRDVTWTGTHFVAVARAADPSMFVSEDGFSWSVESTETGLWPVSVGGDARRLYATGRGLQIIRRTEPLAGREPPRRPGRRVAPVGDAKRAVTPIQR